MPKKTLSIKTADGTCPAGLFTPQSGSAGNLPGVIIYFDKWGARQTVDDMCQTLADAGFMVLCPDLYYRNGAYGPFVAGKASEEDTAKAGAMLAATSQDMTTSDAGYFIATLKSEGAKTPFGVAGYCMGGARAMNTGIAYSGDIGAVASLHGGNLAKDETSPAARAEALKGIRVYVGMAGEDRSFPPEQSARLDNALRDAGVDYTIENYSWAHHGWTFADSKVYDQKASQRQLDRQITLYRETL